MLPGSIPGPRNQLMASETKKILKQRLLQMKRDRDQLREMLAERERVMASTHNRMPDEKPDNWQQLRLNPETGKYRYLTGEDLRSEYAGNPDDPEPRPYKWPDTNDMHGIINPYWGHMLGQRKQDAKWAKWRKRNPEGKTRYPREKYRDKDWY